jgi:hypothetical protein
MTDYTVVERTQTIAATPEQIIPLLVDYHEWIHWSPWEDLDPDLSRTYSGPGSGVGAVYEWSGNRKAGAGRMEVTSATDRTVDMDLDFIKPFRSASKIRFDLLPQNGTTRVVWQVHSPKTWLTRIWGLVMNMDKTVGGDLEKGLLKLKRLAEPQR